MPLIDLSAEEATATRKANPHAGWGERASTNRVEPVARPHFDVPFKLSPGESIFTVGSCFARNVESELARRGFRLPMRELFRSPEFLNIEPGVINNFGTPSIRNELAWAFGEAPFVPEDHILPVGAGRFADLHVIPSLRAESFERVMARRKALTAAYRTASVCRVLIMTLGLVEVWYDGKTGTYLNVAPRPSFLRDHPGRFRLHVLSYEETYRHLDEALAILRRHGQPDLHVLLTVSPVPLASTHRQQDVLVANTYSKSVLRAVAEEIVAKHEHVSYYPSYESVTLSDRRVAWLDDLVHPTAEIVALNVGRMLDAFLENGDRVEVNAEVEAGGVFVAVEKAVAMRRGSREEAAVFFADHDAFVEQSVEFALEKAGFLADTRNPAAALAVLSRAPAEPGDIRVALLSAQAEVAAGQPEAAVKRLDSLAVPGAKSKGLWLLLLRAAMATGVESTVHDVLARWSRTTPGKAAWANTLVGRWYHERNAFDQATAFFQQAIDLKPDVALARIYLAEALIASGARDRAVKELSFVRPVQPNEITRFERLRAALA